MLKEKPLTSQRSLINATIHSVLVGSVSKDKQAKGCQHRVLSMEDVVIKDLAG